MDLNDEQKLFKIKIYEGELKLSVQPDGVNLDYLFSIRSLKYLKSTTLGCKDTEIRKSEFEQRLNSFRKV